MARVYCTVLAWREIGGKKIYMRSRWEYNIAQIFEYLKTQGVVKEWEYEPQGFTFDKIKHGTRYYKPDFKVEFSSGITIWYEVKGFMDDKSATKIKRFRKYFKEHTLVLLEKDEYRKLSIAFMNLIPTWEHDKPIKKIDSPPLLFEKPCPDFFKVLQQ